MSEKRPIELCQDGPILVASRMPRSPEDVEQIVEYFDKHGLTAHLVDRPPTYVLAFPTVVVTRYTRAQLEGLASDELKLVKNATGAICLNRYLRSEEEVAQVIEACMTKKCCYPGGSEDEEGPMVYPIRMPGQAVMRMERSALKRLIVA